MIPDPDLCAGKRFHLCEIGIIWFVCSHLPAVSFHVKGTGTQDYNCSKVVRLGWQELLMPPNFSLIFLNCPFEF